MTRVMTKTQGQKIATSCIPEASLSPSPVYKLFDHGWKAVDVVLDEEDPKKDGETAGGEPPAEYDDGFVACG